MAAKKMGRTSKYNDELINFICEQIAQGNSLISILKNNKNMPSYSTVMLWLSDNKDFSDKYTRAREDQADYLADQMVDIADDGAEDTVIGDDGKQYLVKENILRSKLRVETRKWIASKLKPKKYAERQQIDLDVKISIADKLTAARERAKNA